MASLVSFTGLSELRTFLLVVMSATTVNAQSAKVTRDSFISMPWQESEGCRQVVVYIYTLDQDNGSAL